VPSGSGRRRAGGLALILVLAAAVTSAAGRNDELDGMPSRVFDGDSFMLRVERREIEIRLADIDAPEHGQPYADTARTALDQLIWRERVRVVVLERGPAHATSAMNAAREKRRGCMRSPIE